MKRAAASMLHEIGRQFGRHQRDTSGIRLVESCAFR
jgi:hypothetical protein